MKIYWSLRDVPELAHLPAGERQRVHDACLDRYFWRVPVTRASLGAYAALCLSAVIVVFVTIEVVWARTGTIYFWVGPMSAFLGVQSGLFIFSRLAIPNIRRYYSSFIQNNHSVA